MGAENQTLQKQLAFLTAEPSLSSHHDLFTCMYVSLWVYVQVPMEARTTCQIPWIWRLLGTKFECFPRAVCTLKCWTISPAPTAILPPIPHIWFVLVSSFSFLCYLLENYARSNKHIHLKNTYNKTLHISLYLILRLLNNIWLRLLKCVFLFG